MKQYLNETQTAKLIELGFEKPKLKIIQSKSGYHELHCNYSIGELIEMLDGVSELEIIRYGSGWESGDELRAFTGEELIDSLYDMIIKLKEEGMI